MSVYRTIGPLVISICFLDINVFARFDEIPSMILQDIKETKCYVTVGKFLFSYVQGLFWPKIFVREKISPCRNQ